MGKEKVASMVIVIGMINCISDLDLLKNALQQDLQQDLQLACLGRRVNIRLGFIRVTITSTISINPDLCNITRYRPPSTPGNPTFHVHSFRRGLQ